MAKLALGMNGVMIRVSLGIFLDTSSHFYKRVCPSVRPSVGPSVGPLVRQSVCMYVCNAFAFWPSRSDVCRVFGHVK